MFSACFRSLNLSLLCPFVRIKGVVVLSAGELEIGKSKELTFKITSQSTGVFVIIAQYLGSSLKEVSLTVLAGSTPMFQMAACNS